MRPLPQIEMSMNIGISSISQKMKNSRKSSARNTPRTDVERTSSHMKYSRTLKVIRHDANAATAVSNPVSNTSGALRPSIPRRYSARRPSTGIQS